MMSPLELERYYIKELRFLIKENFVDKNDQFEDFTFPQLQAEVGESSHQNDPLRWRFELAVESKDENSSDFPYSLRIVLVGFFRVNESYPPDRVANLARVNGPSLLYSAAREALVTATSRSGYPAIVLPSVMFTFLNEESNAQKQLPSTSDNISSVDKGTPKRAKKSVKKNGRASK
jgi:preprotein translocase subunit SecB